MATRVEVSAAQVAQFQKVAEEVRQIARQHMQLELEYNEEAVKWLTGFIDRNRAGSDAKPNRSMTNMLGVFLGECLIRTLGGRWMWHDDMLGVQFDDESAAYPINKVAKQMENGTEGGDSVYGFYQVLATMRRGAKPQAGAAHYIAPLPVQPEMESAITKLREYYALRQRRLNPNMLKSLCASAPPWMKEADGLFEILRRQTLLLTEGRIAWGALIQANSQLFKPGQVDCPGLLVYSNDPYFDARPRELSTIGSKIFGLKGTKPADPALQAVAQLVTDEMDRSMGFKLPTVFSNKEISAAAFMVFRQHIPNGVLSCGLFPILTHPSTQAVMIVPLEFWPMEMIMIWKNWGG